MNPPKLLFVGPGSLSLKAYGKITSLISHLLSQSGCTVHVLSNRIRDMTDDQGVLNLPVRDGDDYFRYSLPFYDNEQNYDLIITMLDTYWLSWLCDNEELLKKVLIYAPVDFEINDASLAVNPLLIKARWLAVPSRWAYDQLVQIRNNVHYIPHPISPYFIPVKGAKKGFRMENNLDKDTFVIGCFQANQIIHNIPMVIEAFAKFQKQYSHSILYMHCDKAPFVIYEKKEDGSTVSKMMPEVERKRYEGRSYDLERLARSLGIPDDAIMFPPDEWILNPISDSEMAKLYSAMDVTISLSYAEGFSLPLYESLASGTPIIAPLNTAQSEVVKEYGRPVSHDITHYFYANNRAELSRYYTINLQSAIDALEDAYDCAFAYPPLINLKHMKKGYDYAQTFRADRIVAKYWIPLLQSLGFTVPRQPLVKPIKYELEHERNNKKYRLNIKEVTLDQIR